MEGFILAPADGCSLQLQQKSPSDPKGEIYGRRTNKKLQRAEGRKNRRTDQLADGQQTDGETEDVQRV